MAQLQTGTQILNQTIPDRVIFGEHNYSSTSDAVLNRRHIELPPLNDVNKSVASGDSFTFEIASNTSMIDFRNSYIRMDLSISYDKDGTLSDLFPVMEINGVHSLLDNMEFRVASTQTTINREEAYNYRTALQQRKGFGKRDVLESKRGCLGLSGSGVQDGKNQGQAIIMRGVAGDFTTSRIVNGKDLVITTAAKTWAVEYPYEVGDHIVYVKDSYTVDGYITKILRDVANSVKLTIETPTRPKLAAQNAGVVIPSDTGAFTIELQKAPGDNGIALQYGGKEDVADPSVVDSSIKGRTTTVCWKPDLGIMKTDKLFPLYLLSRGFQLIGKFDASALTHAFTYKYANELVKNVVVSNMRFVAVMYDMHSVINQQYLDLYANRGLLFPFVQYNYQARQISDGVGEVTIDMMVGQRSVRHGIARCTTDALTGTGPIAAMNNTLSSAFGLGLDTYQWSSGSLFFPLRPVDVKRKQFLAYDNEEHMKIMLRQNRVRYDMHSLDIEPWNAPSGTHDRYADSIHKKRIFVYDDENFIHQEVLDKDGIIMSGVFAREEEGLFAGLDTSVQPLRLTCNYGLQLTKNVDFREGTDADNVAKIGTKRLLQLWIASDTYLHISEASGVSRLS